MSATHNIRRKMGFLRSRSLYLIGSIVLVSLVVASTVFVFARMFTGIHPPATKSFINEPSIVKVAQPIQLNLLPKPTATTQSKTVTKSTSPSVSSFRFTAAGDYGQTSATTANLNYIAHSGASFDLGLGDFNYSYPTVSAAQWTSFAKASLPTNFPLEMTEGDHDTGDLSSLIATMPNQMPNVFGTYGQEYYFDYPPSTPFARFIMVSPVLSGNYNAGGTDYAWVSNAIGAARSAGIPWVIVGMAEGCLFINSISDSQPCQSGDLLNLLVSKHVDLILQAHVHNYQASNQLALNSNCTSIPTNGTVNASCIVNKTNTMSKGGTVIVNDGTGGQSLVNIITDPKVGYFRTWMASNLTPTFGVSQFFVTPTNISMKFIPISGGSFTDNFVINA